MSKIGAIVQARTASKRLPGKVLADLGGFTVIEVLLQRLALCELLDVIVVATTEEESDDELVDKVTSLHFPCYRGSVKNVLQRYVDAADALDIDVIVRITADCPLIDHELVDQCIQQFLNDDHDYVSNNHPPSFPDGLDVEVFTLSILKKSLECDPSSSDREHVTPILRRASWCRRSNLTCFSDFSDFRWTLDEPEDLMLLRHVFSVFSGNRLVGWREVLKLYDDPGEMLFVNEKIERNEGGKLSDGQKLWRRAQKVILGGNMLLSKNPDMFLPQLWPAYFETAKGILVTDLEGREYLDLSIMGIGTNLLGYGHEQVDRQVESVIRKGNMSTLNCPEEVELAERLVELHPWAEMVKFARTGGEANAVAIRIARAASGRDGVAVCGYHGWHDWYLSANLEHGDKLGQHLIPGLEPKGVPLSLSGTVSTFAYNNLNELESILKQGCTGVIIMEVKRNIEPEPGFLQGVRNLASQFDAVLIFDECTSGFRESFGGLHLKYGVEPDIAMFGKALGNGYAITAILGKQSVMEAAQNTFVSSTFWTERVGPSAALATLDVMEKEQTWNYVTDLGLRFRSMLGDVANTLDLGLHQFGLPALNTFVIDSKNWLAYKTLVSQEMLRKGYLAGNSVYMSSAHTEEVIEQFVDELSKALYLVRRVEIGEISLSDVLTVPICRSGFGRLN